MSGATGPVLGEGQHGFHRGLIRRPITLLVLFVTLSVIGLIAYARIPIQMMPDGLVDPELWVWVEHPGASAQENEEKVARPLEEQIRTLAGVDEISSRSSEGRVQVGVSFDADVDMDLMKAEVRDRIERARPILPDTVEDIGIWAWNESDLPVMFLAILHPGDSDRTDFLVQNVIQRRLEGVEGVGRVEIHGDLDDSVRILLDEERVRAARLDLGQLITRLSRDNFALPMGDVEDGGRRVLLRSDMRFRSFEEIEDFPVGNGLRLRDVGEVIAAKSVRQNLFRIDGSYSYYAEIQKDSQANAVATCASIREVIDELHADPRLAGEFELLVLFDQGEFIEASLQQLRATALWGGALALVVLLLFLRRLRLTLVVALSIPVSALLAIAWVYFAGGSFNVLTMTGITLAIGMLVDNSVVVIENIARVRALGREPRRAAAEGAGEVALAVVLATLTTIVVFLPLIFMTENPTLRILFGQLGYPLCLALFFSLVVALVFLPVAAARVAGPRPPAAERLARALAPGAALPARAVAGLTGLARRAGHLALVGVFAAARGVLRVLAPLRWVLAAGVVGLVAWRLFELLRAGAPARALHALQPGVAGARPEAFRADALVALALGLLGLGLCALLGPLARRPRGAPAALARWTSVATSVLDQCVAANRRLLAWTLGHRVLASLIAVVAFFSYAIPKSNMEVAAFGQDENSQRIDVYVQLEDNFTLSQASEELLAYEDLYAAQRDEWGFEHIGTRFSEREGRVSLYWDVRQDPDHIEDVRERIREVSPRLPGHRLLLRGDDQDSSRVRSLVAFRLQGPDSEELEQLGREAVRILRELPGLHSVSSSLESSPEQVQVVFQKDLAERLGVTPDLALQNIAWALRGFQLARFQEPDREVPLIIEYDEEQIAGLDTLRELEVFTGASSVPLTTVAELDFSRGSREIHRRDGQITFTVVGRVEDPSRQRAVSQAGMAALRSQLELPRGYSFAEEDTAAFRQAEETRQLAQAFGLSLLLVYLVMGILFESFLLPFSVMFTVLYAVAGAYWTLYLTGTVMDSVGWIGMIILAGVVVNNGIVLIDRIHRLRAETASRAEAVLEGSANRVRPILMTALTTICGLLPMALSEPPAEGIDYRALATCVAGGLAFSTFFTLWVVPLAYTVLDDVARIGAAGLRWVARPLRRGRADPSAAPEVLRLP